MAPAIDFTLVAMLAVAAALVSSTGAASTTGGSEDAICLSQARASCQHAVDGQHAIRDKQTVMEKQLFSFQVHLELIQVKMDEVIHILQSQINWTKITNITTINVAPAPDNLESINQTVNNSDNHSIFPDCVGGVRPFSAPCDGGGWTVIQRRGVFGKRVDFNRNWKQYEEGFGDPTEEFWLGLTHIRALVSEAPMELRIDVEAFTGERGWAKYDSFSVDDAKGKYRLRLGRHSGNLTDSFTGKHNGTPFSTKDRDNDALSARNCAAEKSSGWWFEACLDVNLNGLDLVKGIFWKFFPQKEIHWEHLKSSAMMVRPRE